jgi:Uma2 family endonuclease
VIPKWTIDPADPRAPPREVWETMSPAERRETIDALPCSVPEELAPPPEGDPHRKPKNAAVDALDAFFKRSGRKVYVSSELATYYPDERIFAPDVLAVVDCETHDRERWVVADEGRGLDVVLEIHSKGHRAKDHVRNVRWFAELGIPEYFLFDRAKSRLLGFRLPRPDARVYEPIVPQRARLESRLLGLWLGLEGLSGAPRLRFYAGTAIVPEPQELAERLEGMVDELFARRAEADEARGEAERKLAEALAELERLKRER